MIPKKFFTPITAIVLTCLLSMTSIASNPTKIACIGDSITFGAGIDDRAKFSYPSQLQKLVGENFIVKNFGVNAHTMLSKGDHPWVNHPHFKTSTDWQPDIVVIMLGTNDAKAKNWQFKMEFHSDTLTLIKHFKSLPNSPRIILCTPIPGTNSSTQDANNIPAATIAHDIAPLIRKAADESKIELVDLHTEFLNFVPDLKMIIPDGVHPKEQGAATIALRIADQILVPRNTTFSIKNNIKEADMIAKKSYFHGYSSYHFSLEEADNASCIIVAPKSAIAGQPWIWRARFFDHEPALDRALLDRGYHVCYCDVADLFGSPVAVERWDRFYELTQKLDLSKKPILEGMSRGGLIIFNWAKANASKVAAIYGDNPVCDIRSWPAKVSPNDWKNCLKAWSKTEADMQDFKGNPIDNLEILAHADIPIYLVLGAQDEIVPPAENAHILAERYKALNGPLTIWEKPNDKHHPHGLHPIFPLLRHLLHSSGNPLSPSLYQRADTQNYPSLNHQTLNTRQEILKNSERIVFLGDSITYKGDFIADFITWLDPQPFAPARPVESIINLGLPSETVSGLSEPGHAGGSFPRPDLHERLQRILKLYKPDLIYACYGMNCGLQMPLETDRFGSYKTGISKLKAQAEAAGSKIIFVTPPYYDNHGKSANFNYAEVLKTYSDWLVSKRSDGWEVIDLNYSMTADIKAAQTLDPAFTVQKDHIHPDPAGHKMMTQSLINYYLDHSQTTSQLIDSQLLDPIKRQTIAQRMQQLKLAWLTATGHKRPGIPTGQPLDQIQ